METKNISSKIEGGLRTRGLFNKKSEENHPLISIITVCLNSEKHLEQCIESVASQTYDNIEYIIIDGGSTDRTLEIIKKYDNKITYWVSEPDEGIYDAMNKGSRLANGDYALYLNADDYLYSKDAIEKMIELGYKKKQPLLIVTKGSLALNNELLGYTQPADINSIYKYSDVCHQAVLISRNIYKSISYSNRFKIAGDTEFWAILRQRGLFKIKFVDCITCVFRMGGLSTKNVEMTYRRYIERDIINFLYSEKSIPRFFFRLFKSLIVATIKVILEIILGRKVYYKYFYYPLVHFLRTKFLVG